MRTASVLRIARTEMRRLLYLSFRGFNALKSWLGRRFTTAGRLILAGLGASAVLGIDTNQTMAYTAFTFFLTLLLTSMAWGLSFRPRFTVRRRLPRFATAGEPLSYRVVLANRGSGKQEGLLLVEDVESPVPTYREMLEAPETNQRKRNPFDRSVGYHRWTWLLNAKQAARVKEQPLASFGPGSSREVRTELLPLKRGYLRLGGLSIVCPDPIGLFKARAHVAAAQSLLVLPKRYPLPPLQLPGTRRYQPGGVSMASSVGDSEEFLSLRDYRPGDPLRRIHWTSWAKTGKPIVKEYQDEFFVRHALILDTFQKAGPEVLLEEAVSVAASFAYAVQTQESLLDLMFVGTEAYCFTSGRGISHVDRMLEILACVQPCTGQSFSALFPLVMERASLLSGAVCVLLGWDSDRKRLVGLLKKLGIPVLVLVVTGADGPQTLEPGPMKEDPENLRPLPVDRIRETLAEL